MGHSRGGLVEAGKFIERCRSPSERFHHHCHPHARGTTMAEMGLVAGASRGTRGPRMIPRCLCRESGYGVPGGSSGSSAAPAPGALLPGSPFLRN
ncbi:MAG: hypothetical protein MZU91_00540 [Desulfosudis oleivorans]|nr:hypothetical protein [Desulfosudis oleivorans]